MERALRRHPRRRRRANARPATGENLRNGARSVAGQPPRHRSRIALFANHGVARSRARRRLKLEWRRSLTARCENCCALPAANRCDKARAAAKSGTVRSRSGILPCRSAFQAATHRQRHPPTPFCDRPDSPRRFSDWPPKCLAALPACVGLRNERFSLWAKT